MRDRVERKAAPGAAKRPETTAAGEPGVSPLLALQRSAGNAAVVAMLAGGQPASTSSSSSGMRVGAVNDRAEGEADRMAAAALAPKPLDAGAFASAAPPGVDGQRSPDETVRRFWSREEMTTDAFEEMTLGRRRYARDSIHDVIQDRLDEYLDALEAEDAEAADAHLDWTMQAVEGYLDKNPVGSDPDDVVSPGLARFLRECRKEKAQVSKWLAFCRTVGAPRPERRAASGPQVGKHTPMAGALMAHNELLASGAPPVTTLEPAAPTEANAAAGHQPAAPARPQPAAGPTSSTPAAATANGPTSAAPGGSAAAQQRADRGYPPPPMPAGAQWTFGVPCDERQWQAGWNRLDWAIQEQLMQARNTGGSAWWRWGNLKPFFADPDLDL